VNTDIAERVYWLKMSVVYNMTNEALRQVAEYAKLEFLFKERCERLQRMSLDDMLRSDRLKDNFLNDGWSSFDSCNLRSILKE